MEFTAEELACIWQALSFRGLPKSNQDNMQRGFSINELQDAGNIGTKLKQNLKEDRFTVGTVELNTSEKQLILVCLNRDWPHDFAGSVLNLQKKLEK